jgi:hypothetical protein
MRLNDGITPRDRQMRLPWWGVLCLIAGAVPVVFLFDHFGKQPLALPAMDSAGMIAIVIALRWQLRRQMWFWITMAVFALVHAALIVLVPWPTGWVPAPVIIPIGTADASAMLALLAIVRNFIETERET